MKLHELFNPASMIYDIESGYVRFTDHPSLPLRIYNYTEKAQFSRHWNNFTLACRGLIVNTQTWDIVARPFPKFFNWDEKPPKGRKYQMDMDEPVVVTDKMDGSLGILYPWETATGRRQRYAIATRGSFNSDQAIHANQVFREYEHHFQPPLGFTVLFEIIYPENRIVVNYGGMDDLVLLGAVNNCSGEVFGPEAVPGWPGPRVEVMTPGTLREALSVPPRPGKEGMIVRSLSDGLMKKIKQEDYIKLHRIVTGLSERTVWEGLMEGRDVYEGVPDELHPWLEEVTERLVLAHTELRIAVWTAWKKYGQPHLNEEHTVYDRSVFARQIQHLEPWLKSCLFMKLDGKDYWPFLWKLVRPEGGKKAK